MPDDFDRFGQGTGGSCICTKCDFKQPHRRGVPCAAQVCPKCGAPMTRKITDGK